MTGKRVIQEPGECPGTLMDRMQPGDYAFCSGHGYPDLPSGVWLVKCPNGDVGNLSRHQITEHENGTITVSPSIQVVGQGQWHGWLQNGIWREC